MQTFSNNKFPKKDTVSKIRWPVFSFPKGMWWCYTCSVGTRFCPPTFSVWLGSYVLWQTLQPLLSNIISIWRLWVSLILYTICNAIHRRRELWTFVRKYGFHGIFAKALSRCKRIPKWKKDETDWVIWPSRRLFLWYTYHHSQLIAKFVMLLTLLNATVHLLMFYLALN